MLHNQFRRKRTRKKKFPSSNKDFFLSFSGIFHFVKDNYFRTSSSSSEDEYDSDDSTRKGESAPTAGANKAQPGSGPPANVVAAVTPANIVSGQSAGSDGLK